MVQSRRSEGHTKRGPGGIFKTAAMKVLTEANGLLSSGKCVRIAVVYLLSMHLRLLSPYTLPVLWANILEPVVFFIATLQSHDYDNST